MQEDRHYDHVWQTTHLLHTHCLSISSDSGTENFILRFSVEAKEDPYMTRLRHRRTHIWRRAEARFTKSYRACSAAPGLTLSAI